MIQLPVAPSSNITDPCAAPSQELSGRNSRDPLPITIQPSLQTAQMPANAFIAEQKATKDPATAPGQI